MMRCIIHYFELAQRAIVETSKRADRINFAFLKSQTATQLNKLRQMKFQDPKVDKKEMTAVFVNLTDEISTVFKNLVNR